VKKFMAMLAAVAVVSAGLVGFSAAVSPDRAEALSGAEFDPGFIISDAVFFNGRAMDEARVQSFLEQRIGACTNSNCLSAKRVDTTSRKADAMCGAYQGASGERVSRIIAKVGAACGVNPQVLLVTLQKEQSLVSGQIAKGPSDARLERAMGYACPDSANGGCDPTYAGVYNQLYRAAWQFKRYANPAGTSAYFTQYRPGASHPVLYSPNAACGTKSVYVRNQATANLYYYTPYTPNTAALSNLRGTGDACSAYGNRNFWVYFNDWFGTPTGQIDPFGGMDVRTAGPGKVAVGGWAIDPDTKNPISVHLYVDGAPKAAVTASASRPDVGAVYPDKGSNHGISATLALSGGRHQVCAYGINVGPGSNSLLGCGTVTLPTGAPFGGMDATSKGKGSITVGGWSIDPDTTAPTRVDVYVDGKGAASTTANASRPDVGRAWKGYGDAHGIATTFAAAGGTHQVCAYGINAAGSGGNTLLGCQTVKVADSSPFGGMDVSLSGSTATVRGWTIDPDTAEPLRVDLYVDGKGAASTTANVRRPDVGRAYPSAGPDHGITAALSLAAGRHQVCAYAINVGAGRNALLGCQTVTVTGASPVGGMDVSSRSAGTATVAGWTFDPDQPRTSLRVDVYEGTRGVASTTAAASRPDVARAHPSAGAAHGIDVTFAASAGQHTFCAYGINLKGGSNALLGCQSVLVR
jgi:hypothetical protein